MLEAAYTGNFDAAPLRFGEAISNRVEKAGCQYYVLDLTQRHIDQVLLSSYMFLAPWAGMDYPQLHEVARDLNCTAFLITHRGDTCVLNRDTSLKQRRNCYPSMFNILARSSEPLPEGAQEEVCNAPLVSADFQVAVTVFFSADCAEQVENECQAIQEGISERNFKKIKNQQKKLLHVFRGL